MADPSHESVDPLQHCRKFKKENLTVFSRIVDTNKLSAFFPCKPLTLVGGSLSWVDQPSASWSLLQDDGWSGATLTVCLMYTEKAGWHGWSTSKCRPQLVSLYGWFTSKFSWSAVSPPQWLRYTEKRADNLLNIHTLHKGWRASFSCTSLYG